MGPRRRRVPSPGGPAGARREGEISTGFGVDVWGGSGKTGGWSEDGCMVVLSHPPHHSIDRGSRKTGVVSLAIRPRFFIKHLEKFDAEEVKDYNRSVIMIRGERRFV